MLGTPRGEKFVERAAYFAQKGGEAYGTIAGTVVTGGAGLIRGATGAVITQHHILTDKNKISTAAGGPYTQKFEAILAKAGLKFKDAINKIPVLGHKGPHAEYNKAVYERIMEATGGLKGEAYSKALSAEMKQIGIETQTPGTILNDYATLRHR